MTEILELTEPAALAPAPSTERGPVRWYHVVVLGVAALACAAGVGFALSQSSARDDAARQEGVAQFALTQQRSSTDQARERLAQERDDTEGALALVEPITTGMHEITELSVQVVTDVNAAHQIAMSDRDAVDEYNAAVDRGNAILLTIEAKGEELERQVEALRAELDAQQDAARPIS